MVFERCIQHIKRIIEDSNIDGAPFRFSEGGIMAWFKKNENNIIKTAAVHPGSLTLKAMLWNLDNLKSPIRSTFCFQLVEHLRADGVVTQAKDETGDDEHASQSVTVEKKPDTEIEHALEEIKPETSTIKPTSGPYRSREDWFDKLLTIIAAVVQGFMFNEIVNPSIQFLLLQKSLGMSGRR